MKLKTYKVANLAEAILKIKKDLGESAIVVSAKKVSKRDMWWQLKPMLEVTAVCDVTDESEVARYLGGKDKAGRGLGSLVHNKVAPVLEEIGKFKESLLKTSTKKSNPFGAPVQTAPKTEAENLPVSQPGNPDDEVMKVIRSLLWHGVKQGYAMNYADTLAGHCDKGITEQVLKEKLAEHLLETLPGVVDASDIYAEKKVHVICGRSGSGKSSVILKMATQQFLDGDRRVAFVTMDRAKNGVDESVRRHALILKAPCALVKNERELLRQIERFKSYDLVYVESSLEMANELSANTRALVHVTEVIPADDSPSATDASSIIVSKLDKNARFGNLINIALDHGRPYLAFSTGAQVPEDMEPASLERVIDCLLNFSGRHPALAEGTIPSNHAPQTEVYQ